MQRRAKKCEEERRRAGALGKGWYFKMLARGE
jgi:hypothetical protein